MLGKAALIWLLLLLTCATAAWLADWTALRRVPVRSHLFFGGMLACLVLWLISVRVIDGLWIHFLGVTSLTLLLGWRFAILADVSGGVHQWDGCHDLDRVPS